MAEGHVLVAKRREKRFEKIVSILIKFNTKATHLILFTSRKFFNR